MSRVHIVDGPDPAKIDLGTSPLATDDSSHGSNSVSPDAVDRSPGPEKRSCNVGRWVVRCGFFALLLVGVLAGFSLALRGSANPFELFGRPTLPSVNETQRWQTSGFSGLNLMIENALEDKWTPYFTEYVSEWDNGTPDALTLTTSRVAVDSSCEPALGVLKVCNGNYGNTDWNGINLSLTQVDGYIVSSVSKMNDYFLDGLSENDKMYTMCHEIGHGFGLQHTDENYSNANLGNCLDYAFNVAGNLSPGSFNYDLLAKVYGTVPPSRRLRGGQEVPQAVIDKYHEKADEISSSRRPDCARGRCVEDIGHGYQLVVHKLLHEKA
ncbi:hypothetical protein MHU86_14606 [Fragilaria crotonensis]|nr:hypothetical protein MHU86_14606 [Fragilaria crotonensis]